MLEYRLFVVIIYSIHSNISIGTGIKHERIARLLSNYKLDADAHGTDGIYVIFSNGTICFRFCDT